LVLTDSGSRPCDVINDVVKFAILKISENVISRIGRPVDFLGNVFGFSVLNGAASSCT